MSTDEFGKTLVFVCWLVLEMFSGSFGESPKRGSSPRGNNLVRSPSSPFCTGPSQLQEITMDQDLTFSNTLGVRSPTGRTVKEVEQQLSNFKKENFDLKLRIYFLEEKMGVNYALDKDNVFRKNTELQVQVANLQRELKEKYDLLCQAVKALEMEEDEHRKYSATKEEEMALVQEEMEELKMQLQDMRLMYAESTSKSGCSSSRQSENVNFYGSNRKSIDDGLNTEIQQQQLASFIYDTSETLRRQIEDLQKDCDSKDQAIDSLTRQLSSTNERLIDFAQQVKDYEEKLAEQHQRNAQLLGTMQSVNQKLTLSKIEFEREKNGFVSEKKALDHTNAVLQMRVSALDDEKRQQKQLIRELQLKLEQSAVEAKKKDNVAVASDSNGLSEPLRTDAPFILVARAPAAPGAAQTDQSDAKIMQPVQRSPSKQQIPLTPDAKHLVTFEKLLLSERCRDAETLRAEFSTLKSDFQDQNRKILKLKSEQLKACEIIKSMIKYRNQANDEIAQLKKAKEALEREMESVVGRPQRETGRGRMSELNVTAVGTPPGAPSCEKSNMADDEKVQRQDGDADDALMEQYKQFAIELEAKNEVLLETLKEKDSQMQYVTSQYDEIFELLKEKENRIVDLEFEMLSMNENSMKNRLSMEKGDVLAEKDREIAKLNGELRKCTCYLQEIVNTELWEKNREIEKMHVKRENSTELRKELSCKEAQLKMLTRKIDELGLDIKLTDNDNLLSMEPSESKIQLANELRKTERSLQESNEVCAILSNRLEELAIFLDSLLKQKSILGFLGSAKNKRLREIVNNSLDMSRSLSISLMNPEQSLTQLHNITALLNDSNWQNLTEEPEETHLSIVQDNISLTYQNHLLKKSDNEHVIATLREQVFALKNELKVRDNELNRLQNERESGLEPLSESEREEEKKLTPKAQNSESEAWSEPDRTVSRARIGLVKSAPKSAIESSEEDDLFENLTPSKRHSALMELNHDVYRLQRELDLKSEEIIGNDAMYRQKLQEVEMEKMAALRKVEKLEKIVEELEENRKSFENEMVQKDKDKQNVINELEKEKQGYVEQMGEAKHQLLIAEEQVTFLENSSKQAETDWIIKLKNVEEKCDAEIKIAQESVRLIQEEYARDYLKKVDVEQKLIETENLTSEIVELKSIVANYEKQIESYKTKEKQLEDNVATMQRQLNDTRNNLAHATEKYNAQVATLQKQKLALELKVSELEIGNADLHNRLIKAQTSRFSLGMNATLPALAAYRRFDDGDVAEAQRAEANSSPDLGIESDHGRFSSLETAAGQNIPRPLLPAVRLTESMNDLFDAQMDDSKNICASEQCCQKSIEVAQENNELKRKLLRMKRALEETATQLNLANQRKKQVEKTICKQIHKTSQVLRKAKANLDSGSESDVFRT